MNSTPNTGDGWRALLGVLTDEELNQYGQLAQDQITRELRWRWAQAAAGMLGAILIIWTGIRIFQVGPERFGWLILGLAGLLSYWPYRSAKTRRLWEGHYEAVQEELARRGSSVQ